MKDQDLRLDADRQLVPVEDAEAATGFEEQPDQGNQHQQRAEQRVEEELDCGIDAVGAAPDADDDVHRDQRSLEEDVEQHAVERAEDAVHQAGHGEEGAHVLRLLLFDHFPAGQHHEHGDQTVEQDEGHRNAVHPEQVPDIEAGNPGQLFDELHAALRRVEPGVQRDRDEEAGDGDGQSQPAYQRTALGADGKHQHGAEDGDPDCETQELRIHRFPIPSGRCA
jgi:hypothetical protein